MKLNAAPSFSCQDEFNEASLVLAAALSTELPTPTGMHSTPARTAVRLRCVTDDAMCSDTKQRIAWISLRR